MKFNSEVYLVPRPVRIPAGASIADAISVTGEMYLNQIDPLRIVFTKLHPDAKLPKYMTSGAAGADLFARLDEPYVLYRGCQATISVGLSADIPFGYEVQIRPRSGLAHKYGVTVLNSPGTIDSDYKLEWKSIMINHSHEPYTINPGDAIAQMVVAPVTQLRFAENVDGTITNAVSVSDAVRTGGFGSTS